MTEKQWKTNPALSDYAKIVTLRSTHVNYELDSDKMHPTCTVLTTTAVVFPFGNVWSVAQMPETVYRQDENNYLVPTHQHTTVVVWDTQNIVIYGIDRGSVSNGTIHIVIEPTEPNTLPMHYTVYNGNYQNDGIDAQWYDFIETTQMPILPTPTDTVEVCVDCITVAEMWERTDDDHAKRYAEARKHGTIDIYTDEQGEMSITAFSKSPCEYCGGTLAGERYTAYYHSI